MRAVRTAGLYARASRPTNGNIGNRSNDGATAGGPGAATQPGPASELQRLQVHAEGPAEIGPLQRELDRRLQEAELVARIVAHALEAAAEERLGAQQAAHAVGELDLAAL